MPETQTFRLIGYRPDGTSTCICVTHSAEYAEAIASVLRREMSFDRITIKTGNGSELHVSHAYWTGVPELQRLEPPAGTR